MLSLVVAAALYLSTCFSQVFFFVFLLLYAFLYCPAGPLMSGGSPFVRLRLFIRLPQ